MNKLDRIQIAVLVLALVIAVPTGIWRGLPWGAGALAGGVLSYLNFRWLRATVEKIMNDGGGAIAFAYVFKLTLLAGVFVGLIFGFSTPSMAILIGIGALPLGIVLESAWSSVVPLPADPSA